MKALHHQPIIIVNAGFINIFSVPGVFNPDIFPFFLSSLKEALAALTGKHRALDCFTSTRTGSEPFITAIHHRWETLWGQDRAIAWPWTAVHLITLYLHPAIADHRQQRRIKAVSGWDMAEHVSQIVSGCLGSTSSLSGPPAQTGAGCQSCNLHSTPLGAGSFVFALARRWAPWCNG